MSKTQVSVQNIIRNLPSETNQQQTVQHLCSTKRVKQNDGESCTKLLHKYYPFLFCLYYFNNLFSFLWSCLIIIVHKVWNAQLLTNPCTARITEHSIFYCLLLVNEKFASHHDSTSTRHPTTIPSSSYTFLSHSINSIQLVLSQSMSPFYCYENPAASHTIMSHVVAWPYSPSSTIWLYAKLHFTQFIQSTSVQFSSFLSFA
jgi:hypothetical protein